MPFILTGISPEICILSGVQPALSGTKIGAQPESPRAISRSVPSTTFDCPQFQGSVRDFMPP